jgi:hypothetical protein
MDKGLYVALHELTPDTRDSLLARVGTLLPSLLAEEKATRMLTIGLFMAIWHSDKPQPQQALNKSIAALVDPHPPALCKQFLEAMMDRLTREWKQIDNWRISKYMQFVRYLVEKAFERASGDEWVGSWVCAIVQRDDEVALHFLDVLVESMEATRTLDISLLHSLQPIFLQPKL